MLSLTGDGVCDLARDDGGDHAAVTRKHAELSVGQRDD